MLAQMTQLFGAQWPCLLLAGAWSLGCGFLLRRAWTAEADKAIAAELASAHSEALRLQAEVASRDSQVLALEADLVKQRSRVTDVEATTAAELQMLTMKLASNGAKAAGFDLAREASLKAMAERDRSVAALTVRLQAAEGALADAQTQAAANHSASAKAAADLAAARNAWSIERSTLVDEQGLKLAALQRAHAQTLRSTGSEAAAQAAKLADLAQAEGRAIELSAKLDASLTALQAKDDALAALERRVLLLSPLPARVASAESELLALRRLLADRDAAQPRLSADPARSAGAPSGRDDLKLVEGIGPKIEALLNEAGYRRFSDLADASAEALAAVLERSGPRFALARTDTWPQQAQLLAGGDMAAFHRLTDELKGGVRR